MPGMGPPGSHPRSSGGSCGNNPWPGRSLVRRASKKEGARPIAGKGAQTTSSARCSGHPQGSSSRVFGTTAKRHIKAGGLDRALPDLLFLLCGEAPTTRSAPGMQTHLSRAPCPSSARPIFFI